MQKQEKEKLKKKEKKEKSLHQLRLWCSRKRKRFRCFRWHSNDPFLLLFLITYTCAPHAARNDFFVSFFFSLLSALFRYRVQCNTIEIAQSANYILDARSNWFFFFPFFFFQGKSSVNNRMKMR